ncbi:hypothetical protein [Parabacteroides bouchesdurhonensis]|uniref:PG1828 family lipoprotein n=1 Tax=Parabacteroides bouchesdurhonensis TaxID=1936995 RepID=UPI000C83F0CA|nr:hypothetical protein [Parabacteroides bouchesdurhonensis]RHJ90277.1 hypothetical protein DW095_13305 [Bacteroides sp. AM07-16]
MKKLVAFAAVIAAVSFTSCGNKSAESTEESAVAETETVETEAPVVEEEAVAVEEESAPADSTATVEAAPAE